MTLTHSTLIFFAMLSVLSNGCAQPVSPNCAPAHVLPLSADARHDDAAKSESPYYWVKKGDTLFAISQLFALDYRQVAQWNQIAPPYKILIDQKIRLSDANSGNKRVRDDAKARDNIKDARRNVSKAGALSNAEATAGGKQKNVAAIAPNKIGARNKAVAPLNKTLNRRNRPLYKPRTPNKGQELYY